MAKKQENKNPKNRIKNYAKYSSIPFQMIAIICLGIFAGIKLDKFLVFKFPVFTLLFSVLSVILAIYFAIKDFIK